MKYLITGVTGFIGPHLADLLLEEGHEVYGLVRASNGREDDIRDVLPDEKFSAIRFIYGDVTHIRSIRQVFANDRFDGVFHLAAQSHPPTSFEDPEGTFMVNALGTITIVQAIIEHQPTCRLMFCSTSEVYGSVPESAGPIDETFTINPINPYGVSKAAADLYVRERAKSLKLPFFVTRGFSHTGPRRGRRFSISSDAYQIARVLKGYQKPLIRVGNLSSKRTVIDGRDCVRGYYLLMQNFTPGEAYNIGGDVVYSMGEILDMMLNLTGLKNRVELKTDPELVRPIDIPIQIPNSQKIRSATGWSAQIPFQKTLNDLIQYWLKKL